MELVYHLKYCLKKHYIHSTQQQYWSSTLPIQRPQNQRKQQGSLLLLVDDRKCLFNDQQESTTAQWCVQTVVSSKLPTCSCLGWFKSFTCQYSSITKESIDTNIRHWWCNQIVKWSEIDVIIIVTLSLLVSSNLDLMAFITTTLYHYYQQLYPL